MAPVERPGATRAGAARVAAARAGATRTGATRTGATRTGATRPGAARAGATREPARRNAVLQFLRALAKKRLGLASGIVVLTLILVAVFADVIVPYPIAERHLADRFTGPSLRYLLGTDQLGRDVLSRLIVGTRLSLLIGLAATVINATVSLLVGTTSGFLGGKLDLAVQRFVDAWMAFPGLLLLLTVMSIVGRGLWQIIIVLGVAGGIGASRIIRGAVIAVKQNAYFEAARAVGSPTWRTFIRHLVPNLLPPVIIIFSVSVGGNILAAASLSFLGFGIDANAPDWGSMLSREGRIYMEAAPWLALWPGILLTITIFSLNMFGDALRDLVDPRMRGAHER